MGKVVYICRQCSYSGKPEKFKYGSLKVEILLWCLLIVPGVVYTIWRYKTAVNICPKCHYGPMLKNDSNLGYRMSGG